MKRANIHCVSFLLGFCLTTAPTMAAEPVDYQRQVKPILAAHCYACHGALRQKSGLRLDTVKHMLEGGEGGAVIEPGKPDESRLLEVLSGDAGFQMPPEGEGERLTAGELRLVRHWIEQGAVHPQNELAEQDPRQHWSYQSPQRPAIPTITGQRIRSPLDALIAVHHARLQLQPAPTADKGLLLRRLYLDLIGIPPTAQQRQTFIDNPSPRAYEDTVEQLLASPLHAQRWGRHWMDVWRYSDWYGRRPSNEIRYSQRHIWRWRDWIVQSVAEDKGYDQMLLEMLAGDEVAPTDPDVLRATGYLGRNWYKFDRDVWLFDTVEQTSKAILALPMKCARCHDHKFDPISQQEYYELRAFFEPHDFRIDRVDSETGTEVDNGKDSVLKNGLSRVYDARPAAPTYLFIRGDNRRPDKQRPLTAQVPVALGQQGLDLQPVPLPLSASIVELLPAESARLMSEADQKVQQAEQTLLETEMASQAAADLLTAMDKQAIPKKPTPPGNDKPPAVFLHDTFAQANPKLWKAVNGKWDYADGKLVQRQVTTFATYVTTTNHPRNFKLRLRYRTLSPPGYRSVGLSFDYVDKGQSQDVYTAISSRNNRQTVQAFHRIGGKQVYPPAGIVPVMLKVEEEIQLEVTVRERQLMIDLNGQRKLDYQLPVARRDGKFALWVHEGSAEFLELEIRPLVPTREELVRASEAAQRQVQVAVAKRNLARAEQRAVKTRLAAERVRVAGGVQAELARDASLAEKQVAWRKAELAVRELQSQGGDAASEAKLAALQATVAATRAALENPGTDYTPFAVTYPTSSTGRRTALARWLTQPENPRTARVAVNHIWLRHFGQPLVSPVDDFGPRSRTPALPEVLDWLAVELVENGWSMKHLHRLIVNSEAYRRTSGVGPELQANHDTDPDNEFLWRMNARRMEAEVVRDSLLACADQLDTAVGGAELAETLGQTSHRRSMYFRTTPDNKMEMLELFDLANPNECYRRQISVVPQQSLALINSPLAISQSRLLARRLHGSDSKQAVSAERFIGLAFEQILGRPPHANERSACLAFLERQVELLAKPQSLTPFDGQIPVVPPATVPAIRGRENLVQVLFSHNDFVTIR